MRTQRLHYHESFTHPLKAKIRITVYVKQLPEALHWGHCLGLSWQLLEDGFDSCQARRAVAVLRPAAEGGEETPCSFTGPLLPAEHWQTVCVVPAGSPLQIRALTAEGWKILHFVTVYQRWTVFIRDFAFTPLWELRCFLCALPLASGFLLSNAGAVILRWNFNLFVFKVVRCARECCAFGLFVLKEAGGRRFQLQWSLDALVHHSLRARFSWILRDKGAEQLQGLCKQVPLSLLLLSQTLKTTLQDLQIWTKFCCGIGTLKEQINKGHDDWSETFINDHIPLKL